MEPSYPLAAPRQWHEIWRDVLLHPQVETFQAILREPGVSTKRAFIWVAVCAFLSYLLYSIITIVFIGNRPFVGGTSYTTYALCIMIFSPLLGVAGVAVVNAIYHWIAKLFGGQGSWDHLVYASSAFSSPISLLSVPLSAVTAIFTQNNQSIAALCLSVIVLPIGIYSIVLYVNAIKAVEGLTTGKALLVYFIPVIAGAILGVCLAFAILIPLFSSMSY